MQILTLASVLTRLTLFFVSRIPSFEHVEDPPAPPHELKLEKKRQDGNT